MNKNKCKKDNRRLQQLMATTSSEKVSNKGETPAWFGFKQPELLTDGQGKTMIGPIKVPPILQPQD